MRIFAIIPSFAGGGAEKNFIALVESLNETGNEVVVVTLSSRTRDVYALSEKIKRYDLGFEKRKWYKVFLYFQIISKLRKIAKEFKPDCCLSFLLKTNILSLIAFSRYPVVISERSILKRNDNSLASRLFRRVLYPRASAVVVMTRAAAEDMAGFVSKEKIQVIPNPVILNPSVNDRKSVRKDILALYRDPDTVKGIIVSAGRLHPVKGFDLLIRSFADVAEQCKGWNLLILGEGAERDKLKTLIEENSLSDRVAMPGRTEAIHDYFRACDLYALSSRSEAFGNVIIEAMACDLPVVSVDCPYGPGEIIKNNDNGILVPAMDQNFLSDAILKLIQDKTLRKRISENAARTSKQYDKKRILELWNNILSDRQTTTTKGI